eukprot:1882931-Pyramimonas_sp.AAC.1
MARSRSRLAIRDSPVLIFPVISFSGGRRESVQVRALRGAPGKTRIKCRASALRVTPPAHPDTMPTRVALIRDAEEHAVEERAGEAVIPQEGEDGRGNGGG